MDGDSQSGSSQMQRILWKYPAAETLRREVAAEEAGLRVGKR